MVHAYAFPIRNGALPIRTYVLLCVSNQKWYVFMRFHQILRNSKFCLACPSCRRRFFPRPKNTFLDFGRCPKAKIHVFMRFQSEIICFQSETVCFYAFPIRNGVFLVSLGPWYPAGPLGPSYPAGSLGRIPRSLVQNTPTRCENVFPTRETHSWERVFLSFFGTHFGICGTHFDPHLYAHPDGFIGFWDPSRKIRSETLCKTAVLMRRDL